MAKTVVEVSKNSNENNNSLIRRFSRRVQESGIIPRVKGTRYALRKLSAFKVKKERLRKIKKQKERAKLQKLGRIR
jgi:ribosomal protein S21